MIRSRTPIMSPSYLWPGKDGSHPRGRRQTIRQYFVPIAVRRDRYYSIAHSHMHNYIHFPTPISNPGLLTSYFSAAMALKQKPPPLNIPNSPNIVNVSIINTTSYMQNFPMWQFLDPLMP